jgi:hypothetical protein
VALAGEQSKGRNCWNRPVCSSPVSRSPGPGKVYEANHCVFNMIRCDNDFEKSFARFLGGAEDISAFAELPQA